MIFDSWAGAQCGRVLSSMELFVSMPLRQDVTALRAAELVGVGGAVHNTNTYCVGNGRPTSGGVSSRARRRRILPRTTKRATRKSLHSATQERSLRQQVANERDDGGKSLNDQDLHVRRHHALKTEARRTSIASQGGAGRFLYAAHLPPHRRPSNECRYNHAGQEERAHLRKGAQRYAPATHTKARPPDLECHHIRCCSHRPEEARSEEPVIYTLASHSNNAL